MVYIDDIIVMSSSEYDHFAHIQQVLKVLNASNLRINLEKSEFGKTEIIILGYHVSKNGITAAKEKLYAIEKWSTPTTGKTIEKHLGFFNYFRELIPMYSKLTAPLELLRKKDQIIWTPKVQDIYSKITKILSSNLVLSFPNWEHPFQIATDASQTGIGAVLSQVIDGHTYYISFASRALKGGEKNYGAPKRELLGIIFALDKFRPYIWGTHFTLFTDHKSLVFMFTQKHTNHMINSWLETLTDYDFEVIHKPGIKNILPDRLSRLYPEEETNDKKEIRIWAMNGNNWSIDTPIPIETFQGLTAGTIDSEETQKILMKRAHEEGHFGAQAMHKKLLVAGHKWPRMLEDLQNLVKACITCQRFNIRAHGFHPMTSVDADLPFDHVAIDLKEMERV